MARVEAVTSMREAIVQSLDAVWASTLPLAEKRRLCARVAMAPVLMAAGKGPVEDHGSLCLSVVHEATIATGGQHVGEAAKLLRQSGCHSLAKRLQRASKARNWSAHPDAGLSDEVKQAMAAHRMGLASCVPEAGGVDEEAGLRKQDLLRVSDEGEADVAHDDDDESRQSSSAETAGDGSISNMRLDGPAVENEINVDSCENIPLSSIESEGGDGLSNPDPADEKRVDTGPGKSANVLSAAEIGARISAIELELIVMSLTREEEDVRIKELRRLKRLKV